MKHRTGMATLFLALLAALGSAAAQEEPPLPVMPAPAQEAPPPLPAMGGGASEPEPGPPSLPELPGLGGSGAPSEPALPALPQGAEPEAKPQEPERTWSDRLDEQLARLPFPLHGFWEARVGPRIVGDPYESRSATLGETRLRLESDPYWGGVQVNVKADLLWDMVLRRALVEMREANVSFAPFDFMDVKVGRQVLTWGTGDMIFINDLFPKDYVSFFIGRDIEYLKAPSDALKLSFFNRLANLDVVYTPQFDPDVFVTGKRLSYYNPLVGGRAGESTRLRTEKRDRWFTNDELALRLYRNVGSYELAGYGYDGYWKSPQGINPVSGMFIHPRLRVYGASVRGPFAGGIGNAEAGYYDSRDDPGGGNPFVPNSQWRLLLGYSCDLPQIANDFNLGAQYYLEHMQDYGAYRRTLPPGTPAAHENRHMLTLRLTKLLLNQDLRLDLFTFCGVSDDELHLRPTFQYKITDRWRLDGGANLFMGSKDHTQFAQFERDSNVYVGLRYSF
jgi:hypothetical protein